MLVKELKSVDEVLKDVFNHLNLKLTTSEVSISEALNYILAEDVYSNIDVPPFDRSVVDGFAVRSIDTLGASRSNPIMLKIVRVDNPSKYEIKKDEAVEIWTGSPLPKNADAVLMYEDVVTRDDFIEVFKPATPYMNVSRKGEDLKKGSLVLKKGTRLKPWDIAALASIGMKMIKVYKPKAAIICTGNEVVDLEKVDDATKIYNEDKVINTTRYIVEGFLKELKFDVEYLGVLPDDEKIISKVIGEAIDKYDIIITTAGTSAGKHDKTIEAILMLNPEYYAHGLAIRPGKPTSIAIIKGKPVIMLSGFPVAALSGIEFLLKPIIYKLMSIEPTFKPTIKGKLTRRVNKPINVDALVRVKVFKKDGDILVEPLALTGSGILSTVTESNAFLLVPRNTEGIEEGSEVEVVLTRFEG